MPFKIFKGPLASKAFFCVFSWFRGYCNQAVERGEYPINQTLYFGCVLLTIREEM